MVRSKRFSSAGRPTAVALVVTGMASACTLSSCMAPMPPMEMMGVTDVAMRNIAFDPPVVTILQGQSVRWTNLESAPIPHTTTSGNPGDADIGSVWDSGNLDPGQSSTVEFDEVGEFIYFCEIHPVQMRDARVIVTSSQSQ